MSLALQTAAWNSPKESRVCGVAAWQDPDDISRVGGCVLPSFLTGSSILTPLVWCISYFAKRRQPSMPAHTTDPETLLGQELHSIQEKVAFYAMQTIAPDRLLRLLTLSLKQRAEPLPSTLTAALLTARGDAAKPAIELQSGPSISSAQAAARMGVSDETIRNWIKTGRCIGYHDISGKARVRLPEWQFSGPKTLHSWVAPLIAAYGGNGWALIDFLTGPRHGNVAGSLFNGESLLQRIQSGEVQLVLDAAHRANPE